MIGKILLHFIDIIKSPYLLLFLLYKYIFFVFLGFKTKPISNIDLIKPSLEKTFIRWGDGETNAALGITFSFERSSTKLKNYLNNIINYKGDKILIGLPIKFISKSEKETDFLNIWKTTRIFLKNVINTNKEYGDAFFFREILSIDKFVDFYSGKKLFFISNKNTINKINKYKINNVGTFIIPDKNSFDNYINLKGEILDKIVLLDNQETIIIVSGGPFAKALCYDLTKDNNFVCHDVGAIFDIYLK